MLIVVKEKVKHVFHKGTHDRYSITTVEENKKAIRDALTKCLEDPICRYLEYMWSELSKEKAESTNCLKAKIRSLQKLLSSYTEDNPDKIPERIKEYLLKYVCDLYIPTNHLFTKSSDNLFAIIFFL